MTVQEELDLDALVYVIRALGRKRPLRELSLNLRFCFCTPWDDPEEDGLRPIIVRLQRKLKEP